MTVHKLHNLTNESWDYITLGTLMQCVFNMREIPAEDLFKIHGAYEALCRAVVVIGQKLDELDTYVNTIQIMRDMVERKP